MYTISELIASAKLNFFKSADLISVVKLGFAGYKDIDEFAARNVKKKFTREEIAEMIHEMRKDD